MWNILQTIPLMNYSKSTNSSPTDIGTEFNFENWINENNFNEIRAAFTNNGMTTPPTLSLNYEKFPQLIGDICRISPQIVDKVVQSLQQFSPTQNKLILTCIYLQILLIFLITKFLLNQNHKSNSRGNQCGRLN